MARRSKSFTKVGLSVLPGTVKRLDSRMIGGPEISHSARTASVLDPRKVVIPNRSLSDLIGSRRSLKQSFLNPASAIGKGQWF